MNREARRAAYRSARRAPVTRSPRKLARLSFITGSLLGVALSMALLLVGCSPSDTAESAPEVERCTVDDKDRTTNSDGASVYRVYTDCGVFEVRDLWGADFETFGVRSTVFSMFPNITAATEVTQ